MEDSGAEFPGFQTCVHKDEYVLIRRQSSRLQRRAPRPLQLKPTVSLECKGATNAMGCSVTSSSSSSSSAAAPSSSFNSFYYSKDPIPLLSPLVLPSTLESAYIKEENTARSH